MIATTKTAVALKLKEITSLPFAICPFHTKDFTSASIKLQIVGKKVFLYSYAMSKTLEQNYSIKAPISKVWQAFVDPEIINQWGAGPAKMDDKVGTKFSLWNNDIYGENIEVVREKKLVQNWYGGDWEKPSVVKFTFNEKDGETKINLVHTDLPDGEEDNFADGWKSYYVGAIKELLEK